MGKLNAFIRLIRFPNLIIVGLTMYLMRWCILMPYYRLYGVYASLNEWEFFIAVAATILIAAAGYIVNDIYDMDIDLINKPDKVFIPTFFSKQLAWWMYGILNGVALVISLYLAYKVGNPPLIILFPLFAIPLWLYSWKLKKMPLAGNLLIAFFCAAIALLVIFSEREAYYQVVMQSLDSGKAIFYLFIGYANFAFYSTMIREIIKDMEDVEGDVSEDCRTIPIVWGMKNAKLLAMFFGIVLLAFILFLIYWHLQYWEQLWLGIVYLIVAVIFPLLFVIRNVNRANTKSDFHKLSNVSKFIMLTGLLYLVVIYLLNF